MRLRRPAICDHGIAECRDLKSTGSCFAASPIYFEVAYHRVGGFFVGKK
jgi:hypothetical protein